MVTTLDRDHGQETDGTALSFWERLYLPEVARGMWNALKHYVRGETFTVSYPEETLEFSDRYRGEHILKKDEHGNPKCVACFMCSTACPSHCIHIVAAPAPWDYREKYPAVFEIDELRCISCGYCEEACPCDAIALTKKMPEVRTARSDFLYDREKLLNNYL